MRAADLRRTRAVALNSSTPRSVSPDVRHDGVEHQLLDALRMNERVSLRRRTCRTRSASIVHLSTPSEFAAPRGRRRRRRCRRTAGDRRSSMRTRARMPPRRIQVRAPHLLLHRLAVERSRPGPTLVEHDDAVRGCSAPRMDEIRGSSGSPACPGPPASKSSTPRGAFLLVDAATASLSLPFRRPEWSSGTVSVEHVKPETPRHDWESSSPAVSPEEAAELPAATTAETVSASARRIRTRRIMTSPSA